MLRALNRLCTAQMNIHSAEALGLPRMLSCRKLDVAVRGLGDVAALAVGGQAFGGFQPLAHSLGGRAAPVLAGAFLAAGGLFQVAVLTGGDERSRPGQVRLASEQYPASASTCPMPPPGRCALMSAAACITWPVIGPNHGQSAGSPVSSVAMIGPSPLVMFWALYPWMNTPPRTGISRESGSVMLRTGPGP